MARVVVIFASLSLITGAMFWFARHPLSNHTDVLTTVPVAANGKPAADATIATTTTPAEVLASPQDSVPAGADALPPAEAGASAVTLNADRNVEINAPIGCSHPASRRKCSTSSGISSGRSRNAGTVSVTTARR